ncbi:hypothetical protein FGO68_gene157 [Halteria grandinella]|uniref:Uncharacterized protein n=1 Tax=Halteria grandinella TaxID=5974 RepID=A0A8J8NR79_HALGN|nr:hypothetical protein FGO68_gene157 [Halteria grandinella]
MMLASFFPVVSTIVKRKMGSRMVMGYSTALTDAISQTFLNASGSKVNQRDAPGLGLSTIFGAKTGNGKWCKEDGHQYQGQYHKGKRHGTGKQTWPSGASYEGEYVDDLRQGQGRYMYAEGNYQIGKWANSECTGVHEFYTNEGVLQQVLDYDYEESEEE